MYPNKNLGYTLEGGREVHYVAVGASLFNGGQNLAEAVEDRQTRVWTNVYCRLLNDPETPLDTNEWMATQAQKAVKTAQIELPAAFNEAVIESLGHITALGFAQAARLRVRRPIARDMLAAIAPSLTPPSGFKTQKHQSSIFLPS